MLNALKIALIAGCAMAGFSSSGIASDLDSPIFVEQAPELTPVEIGNGWYIRGDIGANFSGETDNNSTSSGNASLTKDFADSLNAGVGVGYQFNDYFRVDANFERLFGSEFSQSTPNIAPRGPCLGYDVSPTGGLTPQAITNCVDVDTAQYSSLNMMANAYVDLGTYVGFTPYVGAGIGVAKVSWKEETDATVCIPQPAQLNAEVCNNPTGPILPLANTTYTAQGKINNGSDYRMSYAFMAGVGYKASKNLTYDLSYRMLNVGSSDIDTSINGGSNMAKNGFGTQQVRLGVRYSLW